MKWHNATLYFLELKIMGLSLKLSDEMVEAARTEAALFNRSVGGQAEHWMRIGKAIEASGDFTYSHVKEALAGEKSFDDLTAEEGVVALESFLDQMETETPEEKAFWADRREKGIGVGLDDEDNIIYQSDLNG